MSNSPSEILTVHFLNYVGIGAEASPEMRVHQGQVHSGNYKLSIEFDDDPRFLLITATNRDTGSTYEQLVTMAAVSSILMKEKRVNKSNQPVSPKAK